MARFLNPILARPMMQPNQHPRNANRQIAVFVGSGPDALPVVEPALEGQAYEIEFVDVDDEPYATIAAIQPDLVVVSLSLEDLGGFQLLTMLRLDPQTAEIPVLSYVKDDEVSALGSARVDPSPASLPSVNVPRVQRH
jgi:CheY-like chemotaxis protein